MIVKTLIKKSWAALSLRATLTLAFLTFGVLVLSISSGLQSFSSLQTQQAIIASNQHLIAQEAAKSVSYFILEKLGVLETTIWIAEPATMSPAEQQLMLDSLLGLQPAFSKLVLLNAQDQALAQATRLPQVTPGQLTDQLDENVLAKTHQKERYISPVYIDPVTSEPLVIMAVPVTDVFGDFKGSLVAEVNLKFMWDLVAQLKVGKTGYAYVVDRQGNLIAFGDTARVLRGENAGHLEAVREFIDTPASSQATGVSIYRGITGAMVAGTYVPLGTPDWAVVTELPWEEAYQEVIRQVVMSIWITLVMVVMAGLLGVLVARRLAVPLVNLMETSTRIAGGERELRAVVSGPGELANLARAFNSMTAQLQQSLESLEQQVVEVKRAEESLRQANETLQVSERNYREVFNATSDALLIHDETAQVLDVNDRMCTMFGYDHETAHGLSVGDLSQGSPPYSQPEAEDWMHRAAKEGPQVFEWLSKRGNGELFWSEIALRAGEIAGEKRVIASVRDITERKKAEQALRESEERLRQIASSLREVIWLRDVQTRQVLYVNPAFEELTGQTCESFYENPDIVIEVTHPDDKEWVIEALDQRFESAPFDKEHRIIHLDGSVRWVSSRSFPVRNEAGEVYRWASTMEDITERKQAAEALYRSEERLRQAVNVGNIGIFDRDHVNGTLYWSPELRSIYGWGLDEPIAQRKPVEQVHPDDREKVEEAIQYAYSQAGDGTIDVEYRIIDRSGAIHWLSTHAHTSFEGEGSARHPVRTIGAVADTTERKQAEEALRDSESRLSVVFNQSADAQALLSVEPDGTFRLVAANEHYVDRAARYYDVEFSGECCIGKTIVEILRDAYELPEADCDFTVRSYQQVVNSGQPVRYEEVLNTPSGRFYSEAVLAPIFEPSDTCRYILYSARDITERKQAEEEIRQLNEELEMRVSERTKELQEANEEIRHFAYIVSHDLRAPLVNLKGFASELRSGLEVVKEGCDEMLPLVDPARREKMIYTLQEDIPESLRFIESSVSNMDTFTKAILKLSRLGRLRLELVEVDVRALVEKTLETLSYQINQRGVKITVGDLPVVTADFVSMEQIFGNILNNAVLYLDPNRPGEIEISAEQIGSVTAFRIRDNGRGIAKEDMDKVFVPFRRAGKQDVPGEGMGLAYVQTLVRRHGGHIWCDSEAGVGTTFTFTLPRNLINDTVEP